MNQGPSICRPGSTYRSWTHVIDVNHHSTLSEVFPGYPVERVVGNKMGNDLLPNSFLSPSTHQSLYLGKKKTLPHKTSASWFQRGKAFSYLWCVYVCVLCSLIQSFPGQQEWLCMTGSLKEKKKMGIPGPTFCPQEQVAHREHLSQFIYTENLIRQVPQSCLGLDG